MAKNNQFDDLLNFNPYGYSGSENLSREKLT